jgi:hypothetical protein
MDDGAFEVTVEDRSDVNEVEEQPDDKESRYWFGCRPHRIVGVRVCAACWRGGCERLLSEVIEFGRNVSERNGKRSIDHPQV